MITTLMFHRVHSEGLPELNVFSQFLQQLKSWGTLCLPGQPLAKNTHGICLTFDDAYFDFYHYVFPLLKEFQMPAVLAIPTALLADTVKKPVDQRLAVQYNQPLNDQIFDNSGLCSWEEVKEMVDSGWVIPASHGANHIVLNEHSDWQTEIVQSRQILEQRLKCTVSIFIYPYGRFDRATHEFVCQHYQYAMRIGSAVNFNWNHPNKLIYRVNADNYWPNHDNPFKLHRKIHHGMKAISNAIRGR